MGLSVKAKSAYPYKAGLLTHSFTDITVLWLEGDKLLYPIEQRDNLLVARAVVHLDVEFRCDFLIDFTENGSVSGTTEATIPATVNYSFSVGVLVTFRGHIPDAVTLVEAELLPTEIAVDFREIP